MTRSKRSTRISQSMGTLADADLLGTTSPSRFAQLDWAIYRGFVPLGAGEMTLSWPQAHEQVMDPRIKSEGTREGKLNLLTGRFAAAPSSGRFRSAWSRAGRPCCPYDPWSLQKRVCHRGHQTAAQPVDQRADPATGSIRLSAA